MAATGKNSSFSNSALRKVKKLARLTRWIFAGIRQLPNLTARLADGCKWLAILLILLAFFQLSAQTSDVTRPTASSTKLQPLLHLSRTPVEQQLSRYGSLGSIVRDPAGHLWLASRDGLLRYDGHQVERFSTANSGLSNNLITDLDSTDPTALWLLTYNLQLQKMDYQTKSFQTIDLSNKLTTQRFNVARFFGTPDRIWLLGSQRLRYVDRQSMQLKTVGPTLNGLVNRYGKVTATDPKHPDLWVLTDQGQLYRWFGRTSTVKPVLRLAKAEPVEAMIVVEDKIYVLQNKKLLEIDPNHQQSRLLLDTRDIHPNAYPFYLAYEKERLWLSGPDTGLIRYQLSTGQAERFTAIPGMSQTLTDNNTSVLYVDPLANLWVGTVDAGLARVALSEQIIESFALADPIPSNQALRPMLMMADQRLLLSDPQGRVWIWQQQSNRLRSLSAEISAYTARQLADDRLLLFGKGGFYLVSADLQHVRFQAIDILQQQAFQSINAHFVDPSTQLLYVATYYGLVEVNLSTGAQRVFNLGGLKNQLVTIVNIMAAPQGKLWLLTRSDGLLQLEPEQGRWQLFATDHLPGQTFFDFTTDAESRLWFASDQGAFRLQLVAGQLTLDSPVLGITANHSEVRSVHLSADGNVWLHNSEQIMIYRPDDWQVVNLHATQGLLTPLPSKQWVSNQQVLWSGSINGLNRIPLAVAKQRLRPEIALHFRKISTLKRQLELQHLPADQSIRLDYDERQFRLQLAGFASIDISNLRFQMRLFGQQEQWGPVTEQPQFDLYNLPIGQHLIQVRWLWPDLSPSAQMLQLQLEILPPWWRTQLAYMGYSLTLIFLLLLFYHDWRSRRRIKAQHLAELQEKEQQLRMALWGSGDELWDWHLPQQLMLRQNCIAALQSEQQTHDFDLAKRLQQIHPADRGQVQALIQRHLQGESQFYQASYRMQIGIDQWLWVLDRGKITARDAQQRPLRFSGTIQVIEQLKNTEQALTQLNEKLEQLVLDRTAQLAQSNTQLLSTISQLQETQQQLLEVEKMASLGTMVAGLAHELNTPLGVVVTSVSSVEDLVRQQQQLKANQMLSAQFFDQSQQQIQQGCQLASQNLQRMAQLITVFKKLAVNLSGETRSRIKVAALWQSILQQQQAEMHRRQFLIHTDIDPELTIDSYHSALSEILQELLLNSLEHAQPIGKQGEIWLNISLQQQRCSIRYQDNGHPINRTLRSQMFEPFTTSSRQLGHVGLGLSLIYNLVSQLLHGTIRYQCDEDMGWFEIQFRCGTELNNPQAIAEQQYNH